MRPLLPFAFLFAVVTAVFLATYSVVASPVQAQAETLQFDTATPIATQAGITDSGGVSPDEIDAATSAYFTAVEAYRLEESRYNLARDQYYQLNTAASLDEAIRRAKEVLRARAEVLAAYFRYLRLTLQNTKGIDLDDKAAADQRLQALQLELEAYLQQVPNVNDRQQVNTLFTQLNTRSKDIYSAAYGTLILIKIGEIQTAIDTSALLRERTVTALEANETVPTATKEIGRRGLDEITTLLQRASNNLFTLREGYREDALKNGFSESGYRTFQTSAEFSYVQLRQVLEYLKEVQKGL